MALGKFDATILLVDDESDYFFFLALLLLFVLVVIGSGQGESAQSERQGEHVGHHFLHLDSNPFINDLS